VPVKVTLEPLGLTAGLKEVMVGAGGLSDQIQVCESTSLELEPAVTH